MTPTLARRGRLIAASGALVIATGAGLTAPQLVSLGGLVLAALTTAYLAFSPTPIALRRRKVEMSWWVASGDAPGGAVTAGTPFAIGLRLRNRGPLALRVLNVDMIASSAIEVPEPLEAVVEAGYQVDLRGEARARAAGYHVLHGAILRFGDALGLFEARAYFPGPVGIKVLPRGAALPARLTAAEVGSPESARTGRHRSRQRGSAGQIREIREHVPGDPFKLIAWKSTARRGRLMVRDLETEVVATHQILIDVSGSMRDGEPGHRPLDACVESAAALARGALDRGDRVGLITFSTRVVSELSPGSGRAQELSILETLIDAQRVFREDETDLTAGELAATVARYLAHQEGTDVRLHRRPSPGDPSWNSAIAGPGGELYDLSLMARVASALIDAMATQTSRRMQSGSSSCAGERNELAADPRMATLRRLCKLRGIELPYRRESEPGLRANALSLAIHRATRAFRPDSLVIVSDLGAIVDHPERALPALSRARRAGRRVFALAPRVAPFETAGSAGFDDSASRRAAAVIGKDAEWRLAEGRRLLAERGIPHFETAPAPETNRD